MVWKDFRDALVPRDNLIKAHICVGDLFDKFVVPPEVVLQAAETYILAAKGNPNVVYYVLRGNHDASRDADKNSSFDIFKELCLGQSENLRIVDNFVVDTFNDLLLVPWHPFKTAEDMVANLPPATYRAAIGHWDVEAYGEVLPDNLVPYGKLSQLTDLIVTGHIHTPKFMDDHQGMSVAITGSLQPYSHGEDPAGEVYITTTLPEAVRRQKEWKNKAIRVRLQTGEIPPPGLDQEFLQFSVIRGDVVEDEKIEVKIDDFDFKKLFTQVFDQHGVSGNLRASLLKTYEAKRNAL